MTNEPGASTPDGDERPARTATQYLLGDRRVAVADLVDAGLLEPEARLVYRRPRIGDEYWATVTDAGTLRLDDGRELKTPSRAAMLAANVPSVDGWEAWTVEATGEALDTVRQRLLEAAAAGAGDVDESMRPVVQAAQQRHQFLRDARTRAEAGQPAELTVRDLLEKWQASRRGNVITQHVEDDLADHGLVTTPDFRAVALDSVVALTHPVDEPTATEPVDELAVVEPIDTGLTLGNIPSALASVLDIAAESTLDEAVTLMRLNGYSQLAVLNGRHHLRGAVTWQSIAECRHFSSASTLRDAIVPARDARFDAELIDVLDVLYEHDFVFVRNEHNEIAGIVTTADVVNAYGELATPFFIVGEIDRRLRRIITDTFTIDVIAEACRHEAARPIGHADDLSFGDYQRVLEHPDRWRELGWPLDRKTFVTRLQLIRELRNDLTHFSPDPLPDDAVPSMRHFLKLLRELSE